MGDKPGWLQKLLFPHGFPQKQASVVAADLPPSAPELSDREGIVLLADVRFLTAAEGGRTKPAGPGHWASAWGGEDRSGEFGCRFSFQFFRPDEPDCTFYIFRRRERLLLRSLVPAAQLPAWMSAPGALLVLSEDPRRVTAIAEVVGVVPT